MIVSLCEAQVMDYLLKKLQYRGFIKKLTEDNSSELKWMIYYKNNLIKTDFVDLKDGSLVQKNYLGPYDYELTTYYEPQIQLFTQAWTLFFEKYFTSRSIGQFENLEELAILFEMLLYTVKEMNIQTNNDFLRPELKNVIFNDSSSPLEFIYLERFEDIDIISLTCHIGGI
ncbi:hypothetical protein ACTHOQ_17810 [Solibacillus silvestris]|uniref:hypothetical protein n=1 Tax=Solibacillus silvestris TaxID=76853 RepID=UPI003F8208BB